MKKGDTVLHQDAGEHILVVIHEGGEQRIYPLAGETREEREFEIRTKLRSLTYHWTSAYDATRVKVVV